MEDFSKNTTDEEQGGRQFIYEEYRVYEFAKLVTGCRGVMFTFMMLCEEGDNNYRYGEPYNIVCLRLFESWGIFFNSCHIDGGAPFMVDLPLFDEDLDVTDGEYQSEKVLKTAEDGLNRFYELYGGTGEAKWLIAKQGSEIIDIERRSFV